MLKTVLGAWGEADSVQESHTTDGELNTASVHPGHYLWVSLNIGNGRSDIPVFRADLDSVWNVALPDELDFEDAKGLEHAKRGLYIQTALYISYFQSQPQTTQPK